jgi:nicotinamidase-related amidase
MTSAPVRDPLDDHLITPENAAFLFIDYQPSQLATIRSMDPALLLKNAVSTVRTIKTFGVPVVHSTVNVANGQGLPALTAWSRLGRSRSAGSRSRASCSATGPAWKQSSRSSRSSSPTAC